MIKKEGRHEISLTISEWPLTTMAIVNPVTCSEILYIFHTGRALYNNIL